MKWSNKLIASSSALTYLKLSFISYVLVVSPFLLANQHNISPREYLVRVIDANNTQDFSGIFIYEHADYKVQTYIHQQINKNGHLRHWVKEVSNGEGFLRINGEIKCITKTYNKLRINTFFESIHPPQIDNILDIYDVRLGYAEITVANRKAYELIFQAIEGDRYTYKLAFDKETFMPLQFIFLDQQQNILERGSFSQFTPGLNELTNIKPITHCLNVTYQHASEESIEWLVGWMPNGFNLKHRVNQANIQSNHLMYTDSLVSFSVFIEPLVNNSLANIEKHFGATTVVSRKVIAKNENNKPYLVTVVGEIPLSTALHIASTVYQK